MRFLDIEHYLGLRGGDTWSEDGNEGTIFVKYSIGQILARYEDKLGTIPDLYLKFAELLEPNDIVITFNYDTLLERALSAVGKPFRLAPYRYKEVRQGQTVVDNDKEEVVVLKVHGSIDWFDRSFYEQRIANHRRLGASDPVDVIFSRERELAVVPLIDGVRDPDDPLSTVHRVQNVQELYRTSFLFHATPRLLTPSAAKLVYASRMGSFWDGFGRVGHLNFGLAIIGFSLPIHDDYARQIIYRLVTNYQQTHWDEEVFGQKKSPAAIVDFFASETSKQQFLDRYRFVDWTRANLISDGFNIPALDTIFAE